MNKPLEKDIENPFVTYAQQECGMLSLKMSIPGRRNYPDQQIFLGNGYSFFIEFKRPGEEPRRGQLSRHKKLRIRGYKVYVCDNLDRAKKILHMEMKGQGL